MARRRLTEAQKKAKIANEIKKAEEKLAKAKIKMDKCETRMKKAQDKRDSRIKTLQSNRLRAPRKGAYKSPF